MSATFWSRSNEQHQQKQEDQDDRASDSKISEKDRVTPQANDADLNPRELTFEEGAISLPFQ
jgi:L-type amino acid transporter 9